MRCRYAAAAGLLALLAACSSTAAAPHAAKSGVPAQLAVRGTLSAVAAGTVYNAAIVPAYPLAVAVADKLANHPAAAAAAVTNFTARLSKALASFSAVTAFPPNAEGSFAAYRTQARYVLASLAQPTAVAASESARKQAALELYAFARQIGVLGADLHLVPATEQGGRH
ncbi:MAG: hypothetical protein JO345_35745 [Streptosporangiaceae bacterium]|nr:hypothetical protein [Streptosporangiaceae bacterium]